MSDRYVCDIYYIHCNDMYVDMHCIMTFNLSQIVSRGANPYFASNYGPQKSMKKHQRKKMQLWGCIQFAQDSNRFESNKKFTHNCGLWQKLFAIDTEGESLSCSLFVQLFCFVNHSTDRPRRSATKRTTHITSQLHV